MKVVIESPHIEGSKVTFRWTQSAPNPFQRSNFFDLRFADIDLERFNPLLFYEIFLAYQVPVFKLYREPIELAFREPVPRATVRYWLGFHAATGMTVGPVSDVESYSPWRRMAEGRPETPGRYVGMFFGGGKDSMLASSLLAEVHGNEEILLIQFVHAFVALGKERRRLEQRQERLMLQPMRESTGMATQLVWTNFLSQLTLEGRAGRPDIGLLYPVGSLPAILAAGARLVGFSLEYSGYWTPRFGEGRPGYGNALSRPESLARLSEHFRCVLGEEIRVTNMNYFLTELVSFKVLAERYPDAFGRMVMCVGAEVGQRWCLNCKKCTEYAMYSLYFGVVDPDFDYDALFAHSRHVNRIVDYATSGAEPARFGNLPWQPFISTDYHFSSFCHVMSRFSPDPSADRLSNEARGNIAFLKAAFGNHEFPGLETMVRKAVERIDHDSIRQIASIVSAYVPVVNTIPGPILVGNKEVVYDFDHVMPTATPDVELWIRT